MAQHHFAGLKEAGRICVFCNAVLYHTRSAAVDSFKHCVSVTDVCTSGCTYASLNLSGFIGDYIAVEIWKDKYIEVGINLIVNQICSTDVHVPVVSFDLRIFLCHFVA